MTIADIEHRGKELRDQFKQGAIGEDEFRAGMSSLRFQDANRRWWMLGAQSSKWYVFTGTRWMPGTPPDVPITLPSAEREPPQAPVTPQVVESTPLQESVPPAEYVVRDQAYVPETETVTENAPSAPPESVTTYVRRQRAKRPFAVPLLVYAVSGVAVALFVGALLFSLDNLAPGKPISQLFGNAPAAQIPPPAPSSGLPGNVIAMISAGDQTFAQGQIDAALAQYQKAAQAAPTSAIPQTRLARTYAFKGQMQEAIARGRQAVKLAPDDAEAGAQLCRALTWDGEVDEGIKTCESATKADSKNVNAHAFLTEAYLQARRVTDAKAQATVAVQLAPQSAEAHRAQAWVLTLSGQKDAAVAEWKQTQALEPNLFYRHYEVGEVQRIYFNSPADAVPAYQKSLALYSAYVPATVRLGLALIDINQAQNAIPHLRRAATFSPNDPQVIAALGVAYQKTNQCSQAIPYFEQALKIDANNSMAQRGSYECKTGAPAAPPSAPTAPSVPIIPPTLVPGQ